MNMLYFLHNYLLLHGEILCDVPLQAPKTHSEMENQTLSELQIEKACLQPTG